MLDAVVRLDVIKGHLRWSISDLARTSGVGRTLIYYYFGKSKGQLIEAAVKMIGDEIFGLSEERENLWKNGQMSESISKSREVLMKAPHLLEFYFHWRHTKSEMQQRLQGFETAYLKKLRKLKPDLSQEQCQGLFALLFGLVTVPVLTPQALAAGLGILD
ncbi:MAG: TetR/AcrR family transcriptional regulator [Bdellovibrionales bacterium]